MMYTLGQLGGLAARIVQLETTRNYESAAATATTAAGTKTNKKNTPFKMKNNRKHFRIIIILADGCLLPSFLCSTAAVDYKTTFVVAAMKKSLVFSEYCFWGFSFFSRGINPPGLLPFVTPFFFS